MQFSFESMNFLDKKAHLGLFLRQQSHVTLVRRHIKKNSTGNKNSFEGKKKRIQKEIQHLFTLSNLFNYVMKRQTHIEISSQTMC